MGGAVSGVAGANWALVGDAAACVNPLNGEGIDYGLEGGRLVAELIADDADLATAWPATLTEHYGESFSIARRLAGLVTVPRVAGDPGPGRDALRLADDPRPALDGQPGHRRRPRPRGAGLALGRPTLPRPRREATLLLTGWSAAPTQERRMPKPLPKLQRVAAYALILRDDRILLTRLASRISADEKWHLPGGGVDHGENPRDALVREIREETGLDAEVGDTARVYSAHLPSMWRQGRRWDYQALRIVYDAWVPTDAPEPRVVEVDGSTVDVDWHPVADVLSGGLAVTDIVTESLADHQPFRLQRVAVYALVRRGDDVLLTRHLTARCPSGRVDAARRRARPRRDAPRRAWPARCARSAASSARSATCSTCTTRISRAPRRPVGSRTSTACTWSSAARSPTPPSPGSSETDGTTDAVAWVPVADIESGAVRMLDVVRAALAALRRLTR